MEMKKLGFGCMRLPLIHKRENVDILAAEDIDLEETCRMVDTFLENGFTYFDTSYVYHNGKSEIALREALVKRYPREQFVLANKLPAFQITEPWQPQAIFEEQLAKCGVEYFDYYLLHCVCETDYETKIKQCDEFAFLKRLQKEGRIKHLGISYHDTPEVLDRILTEHPEIEFVQIALNYFDWTGEFVQSQRCYEVIRQHGRKVIVMQPVKGGLLAKVPEEVRSEMERIYPGLSPASWAIRFAAGLEDVMIVLSGMSSLAQMEDNICNMQNFTPLCAEALAELPEIVRAIKMDKTINCSGCGKCNAICPENIHISEILTSYNTIMLQRKQGLIANVESNYYLPLERRNYAADRCTKCNKCQLVCPEKLDVVAELQKAGKFHKENSF